MSMDNENEALENEDQVPQPAGAGVATAQPGNLDNAMAALIRAARPSESATRNPFEPYHSSTSAQTTQMPEEDDATSAIFGSQPAAEPTAATPVAEPMPVAEPTPEPETEPEPSFHTATATVPVTPPPAVSPESVASQPTVAEPKPMPETAIAISVVQDTNNNNAGGELSENHLVEASKYIGEWLADNADNEEVIQAAIDWARKHGAVEHNGYVLAILLLLEDRDNELTLLGVRWLTKFSTHPLAPEIVVALTRKN